MTLPAPVDADYLRAWARHTHRSPLYAELIAVTIDSPELMDVIQQIHNRPPPNVYLAAVHFLLLAGRDHPLRNFYASIVDDPLPVDQVATDFRDFVTSFSSEVIALANERYTQTNECRRCVALLPGVSASGFDRLHLVEIGTSAGLNLGLDLYRYDYEGEPWGPDSPLVLTAGVPGEQPRLSAFEVRSRTGIDLNIIDRRNPDDRMWLDALIWPEHSERRERLRTALDLTNDVDMTLVEGSVLDELGPALEALPDGDPVVVMNSFVLNQLDPSGRDKVAEAIDEARSSRPIFRVSLEFIDKDDDWARLEVGLSDLVQLGTAHPHGEWVNLDYSGLRLDS